MALDKQDIEINIADKLYASLVETGKSIRRLFTYFFALLIILSAITYEPEIFSSKLNQQTNFSETDSLTNNSNQKIEKDISEDILPIFGFKISKSSILKYSSITLAILYLMLTTFLIYSRYLRDELKQVYKSAFPEVENSVLDKLNYPSMHFIINELSSNHKSIVIQLVFQILNVLKSLIIYVLPMVVVISFLGESITKVESVFLKPIFYSAPIIVAICMFILTKEWYIALWNAIRSFFYFLPKLFDKLTYKRANLYLTFKLAKNYLLPIIASILALLSVIISILSYIKKV